MSAFGHRRGDDVVSAFDLPVAPHVERVLTRLAERRLNPRPHDVDVGRWDAECPVCGGWLVLRDGSWDGDSRRVMLFCDCDEDKILRALGLQERDLLGLESDLRAQAAAAELTTVTVDEFVSVEEPGARAVLGSDDAAVIPEGADVMFYGDGGAGKTTLAFDLAFHLAAGDDWLEIPVQRPVRVLLIENEGPRPLLRRKLGRKREAWAGGELSDRLRVFERPWGEVSLQTDEWREQLALTIAAFKIDVLTAGPVTRLGMDDAGTLQEVRAFMELVADLRRRCGRPLTVILIHHENKAGRVSGAWEGSGDTLLHVESAGNGHTIVHVQKSRWDPERHGTTLKLAWTDGEGFELEGDRDYRAEVIQLCSDGKWRTVEEIAAKRDADPPGVGASAKAVKNIVEGDPDRFESRTGRDAQALGRSYNAILWRLGSAENRVDRDTLFSRLSDGAEGSSPSRFSIGNRDDKGDDTDVTLSSSSTTSAETTETARSEGC